MCGGHFDTCRMCKIVSGDTVCDPMCGGGSIPIEVDPYSFFLKFDLIMHNPTVYAHLHIC